MRNYVNHKCLKETKWCKQLQTAENYFNLGKRSTTIVKLLREESWNVCKIGVGKFLKFRTTGSIGHRLGSITPQVLELVDRQMQLDDETTVSLTVKFSVEI